MGVFVSKGIGSYIIVYKSKNLKILIVNIFYFCLYNVIVGKIMKFFFNLRLYFVFLKLWSKLFRNIIICKVIIFISFLIDELSNLKILIVIV